MTRVKVLRPGLLTTVQDPGRWGYEQWGMPLSGVMDEFAAHWANWLVGNEMSAAVLEVTAIGPELEVLEDGVAALAGADLSATLNGERWAPGEARLLTQNDSIRFGARVAGMRGYLAVPGGVAVPLVLGSRSTDLAARVGGYLGRSLRAGDEVASLVSSAEQRTTVRSTMRRRRVLRVIPGVRLERFPDGTWARFLTDEYEISGDSSRMGLRLKGGVVAQPRGDWPSEGMAIGSIQCPPSGHPVILTKDRGSIGGYPVVAHVARMDWPALAQLCPGDRVHFEAIEVTSAVKGFQAQMTAIGSCATIDMLSTTAPFAAMVHREDEFGRALAQAGEWVEPSDVLVVLESCGFRLPLKALTSGVLQEIVDTGTVCQGDQLWCIRREEY